MARKEIFVTIDAPGRDLGKVFKLTEWSAIQADKWASRAALAIIKAGGLIPDEILKMGIVGLFMVGMHRLQGISWSDLEPLLDEMMGCIRIVPTPSNPNVERALFPDDIEEVSTLATLRKEVFALHVGFTPPVDPSKSRDAAGAGT